MPADSRAITLHDVPTPALVLDRGVVARNVARMAERMRRLGVPLRPHLKTAKCVEVARLATAGQPGGVTVSTLAEAAFFARHGFPDITYAVAIVPSKLDAVAALQREGARVRVLTDDVGVARALGERAQALGIIVEVLIEVDTGDGRGGVAPESSELLDLATILDGAPGLRLVGVLTHAGHSYASRSVNEVRAVAEQERAGIVRAAARLRESGLACPVVSAGSTPTATHAASLDGVSEMRPGNYVFYDLAQVGLGSCTWRDIGVSVLATVIGRARDGRVLIDAGSLALSSDTSANRSWPGVGYGVLCDVAGRRLGAVTVDARVEAPFETVHVERVNQEHGFVVAPEGDRGALPPIGSRVRILPNHSCITSAMFDVYHVVDGGITVLDHWQRVRGWAAAPA